MDSEVRDFADSEPRPDRAAASNRPGTRPGGFAGFGNGPTWMTQVLAKGWGYATINTSSIQADNGAGLTQGIIGLVNKGQPCALDDWGALSAWAWAQAGRWIILRRTVRWMPGRLDSRVTRGGVRRL